MRESRQEDRIFGKVLRELRLASGKSQEVLAMDAGLERTFISMLELGQRCPSLNTLSALARGLDSPLSDIILRYEEAYRAETGKALHHQR
jgi:transcriptional regulator with XRE-family HTH domain